MLFQRAIHIFQMFATFLFKFVLDLKINKITQK